MTTIDLCCINYNTQDKLQRFIETLHSDYNPYHPTVWNLHIADNGSTDNSAQWLEAHTGAYYIDNIHINDNVGYAAAANDLAYDSKGDIIAILNADVWMTTADVRSIAKTFDDHPEVSILGPKQRDEVGKITHAGIFGTNTAPKHRGWQQHDPDDVLYRTLDECVTVSGSAYFVRRDVWNTLTNNERYQTMLEDFRSIGLITDRAIDGEPRGDHPGAFLPTRHYYEETWVSYFARHLGFKVFYEGRVSIGHSWHASSGVGGEADRLFSESKNIFNHACEYFGIEHD